MENGGRHESGCFSFSSFSQSPCNRPLPAYTHTSITAPSFNQASYTHRSAFQTAKFLLIPLTIPQNDLHCTRHDSNNSHVPFLEAEVTTPVKRGTASRRQINSRDPMSAIMATVIPATLAV